MSCLERGDQHEYRGEVASIALQRLPDAREAGDDGSGSPDVAQLEPFTTIG